MNSKKVTGQQDWSFSKWFGRMFSASIVLGVLFASIWPFLRLALTPDTANKVEKALELSGRSGPVQYQILIGMMTIIVGLWIGIATRKRVPKEDFDQYRAGVYFLGASWVIAVIFGAIYFVGLDKVIGMTSLPAWAVLWGLVVLIISFCSYRGRMTSKMNKVMRISKVFEEWRLRHEKELPEIKAKAEDHGYQRGRAEELGGFLSQSVRKVLENNISLAWLRTQGNRDERDLFKVRLNHEAGVVSFAVLAGGHCLQQEYPLDSCRVIHKPGTDGELKLTVDLRSEGEYSLADLYQLRDNLQTKNPDLLEIFQQYVTEADIFIDPKHVFDVRPVEIVRNQSLPRLLNKKSDEHLSPSEQATPPDSEPLVTDSDDTSDGSDEDQELPITPPELDPDDTNPSLFSPPPDVPDKEK